MQNGFSASRLESISTCISDGADFRPVQSGCECTGLGSHQRAVGAGRAASCGNRHSRHQPGRSIEPSRFVASPEAFRASGLDYNVIVSSVEVKLQKRPDGRSFLRLTSTRPVNDPFLDLILETQWSTGRIVRDYTMLFDPPSLRQQAAPTAPQVAPAPPGAVSRPAPAAPLWLSRLLPQWRLRDPQSPHPARDHRLWPRLPLRHLEKTR